MGAPPRPTALCGRVRPAQRPAPPASQHRLCDAPCASSSPPPGPDSAVAPSRSPLCPALSENAQSTARRLTTLHSIYLCGFLFVTPAPTTVPGTRLALIKEIGLEPATALTAPTFVSPHLYLHFNTSTSMFNSSNLTFSVCCSYPSPPPSQERQL